MISQVAVGLKKGLQLSMQDASDGEGDLCTEGEQQERFNNWTRKLSELQRDPRIDRKRMKELDCGFDDLIAKLYETVLHDTKWGEAGGGKNSLEWYGNCGDHAPVQKRKRGAS